MNWKRRLSLLQVILLIFCIFVQNVFSADAAENTEDTDYPSVTFGVNSVYNRVTCVESWPVVTRDGKQGKLADPKNDSALYCYVNVDDSYLYDIPIDVPVEVTVEYYDEGNGFFTLDYDSHNYTVNGSYPDNVTWRFADSGVQLTDTKQWKTHTYYLMDMKMANRVNYGSDFRIGVWSLFTGYSPEAVVIGSITVKKADYKEVGLVKGVSSAYVGNIFDKTEDIKLDVGLKNITDKSITQRLEYRAVDAKNNVLCEGITEEKLSANEERATSITLENIPEIYGIYHLQIKNISFYDDSPEKLYCTDEWTDYEFSRVFKVSPEDENPNYGTVLQVYTHRLSSAPVVAGQMSMSGLSVIREECPMTNAQTGSGEFDFPDRFDEMIKAYRENDVQFCFIASDYNGGPFVPDTDEEIENYAKYCAYAAKELKGVAKYIEIWNEYNITNFNATNEPPETYAKMCIAAYKAIKEVNPDIKVCGLVTAHYDLNWIKRVFDAGAYDYMDVVSIHPYDWSENYRWNKFVKEGTELRELMRQYGEEKPVLFSEIGFSTNIGGYTRNQQAANTVMMICMSDAYGLAEEGILQYCLNDRNDRADVEHNWGLNNWWEDKYSPNGAKESYLAIAAANNYIGKNADYISHTVSSETRHAFLYHNNKMDKDILLTKAEIEGEYVTYDLGTSSVEVYDMFGNKLEDLYSADGKYSLYVSEIPVYYIGDIKNVQLVEGATPAVVPDRNEADVVNGDEVTFTFKNNTGEKLSFSAEGIEVVSIGDTDGGTYVKVRAPEGNTESTNFNIFARDETGNVRYLNMHRIFTANPITAEIENEKAADAKGQWRLRVTIKNMSYTQNYSGDVSVTYPSELLQSIPKKVFSDLKPQEERVFLLNLPSRVIRRTMDCTVQVNVDGNIYKYNKPLDFGEAVYMENKPTIDGVIKSGEWSGSWIGADEEKDVQQITDWKGPTDLSFSACFGWDEDNLYMMAIVTDNVFSVQYTPSGASNMWRGDSIQIGINDNDYINPMAKNMFTEIGIADVPGEGGTAWRFRVLYDDVPVGTKMENCEIAVSRYDGYTLYECKIPWDEIFYKDYQVKDGQEFWFSALINDNDGTGRRGWIEYTSGIGWDKDTTLFGKLILSKNI